MVESDTPALRRQLKERGHYAGTVRGLRADERDCLINLDESNSGISVQRAF
jgi:hypothetical protein